MSDIKRPVKIMDTTLRDGQQSLIATRMSMDDMYPIIEKMDNIGLYALEVWGGATFDSCLRFLKEDPWERLRTFRKICKNSKLQMLFRGQNILGYKAYPDDVVEEFVYKSVENGIDILRIFDALNDVRNLESSVKAVKKVNSHAQLCISYTLSDVHTHEYYMNLARQLVDMGADSICIKDMAGLILPKAAYEMVKGIREITDLPIEIHSHYTSGVASMSYMKAIEAGADIIDTAMSPFALGTSQPATEVMVAALKDTPYDTGIKPESLNEITSFFAPIREKALASGLLSTKVLTVDINTLLYQVPGGMLSNLVSQLKDMKAEDKYNEVLAEIPRVRADLGYPPLVTPTSQIVGTQAVMNVISGQRYKVVTNETKDIVRGLYGKTPVPIKDEIRKLIIGDEIPTDKKPSDMLEPGLKKFEEEMKEYKEQDEDVLSYALFPKVAVDFFKFRQAQKYKIDPELMDKENKVYPV
ncbi:oxaloacetate decarboxylase subunit alpha [Anaeropeptidivorans aminofermentans]|jgi:oxaloacetate decarboxylase alpha subunit|uniref:oxaloacetate decarboxylase subunit alpha n=1 Tax=Anaeropeptidivorans aminofermentans TaxID=2934315 RepID=UPI0020240134|nr:oxaloacetate decarboxylase subunit alpha [Anaeropeptidivorans aminofermentans]MBE6012528.1 oxaloacetate decarboxylase subunit alpha [Lachnospiraceae bacterium]